MKIFSDKLKSVAVFSNNRVQRVNHFLLSSLRLLSKAQSVNGFRLFGFSVGCGGIRLCVSRPPGARPRQRHRTPQYQCSYLQRYALWTKYFATVSYWWPSLACIGHGWWCCKFIASADNRIASADHRIASADHRIASADHRIASADHASWQDQKCFKGLLRATFFRKNLQYSLAFIIKVRIVWTCREWIALE